MDIIAGVIELLGLLLIGNKNRFGFVVFFVANLLWTFLAMRLHIYGLMMVTIPAMVLNCRNYRRWRHAA